MSLKKINYYVSELSDDQKVLVRDGRNDFGTLYKQKYALIVALANNTEGSWISRYWNDFSVIQCDCITNVGNDGMIVWIKDIWFIIPLRYFYKFKCPENSTSNRPETFKYKIIDQLYEL